MGWLTLISGPSGLRGLRFGKQIPEGLSEAPGCAGGAVEQLEEYFSGQRRQFDLRLDLQGTKFQLAVWQALREIPYGETRSYGTIAAEVGHLAAARAVGLANNRNPVPIIVPCHRVIGQSGALTGYAGGLELKTRLLSLEGALPVERSRATVSSDRGRATAFPIPALF